MNPVFLFRLCIDLIVVGLLLFAFAYFWQGNAAHEWVGIAVFLLVCVHNVFHRRWFAGLATGKRESRDKFNIALTFALLAGMLALLGTSLVISETLVPDFRMSEDFMARRIHAGIAYWLLLIVSMHLGLRWPLLMGVGRKLLGLRGTNSARSWVLRAIALGVAVQGVRSLVALNVRSRLSFQMSLDWWNFEESVAGFFAHCMAVAGLCVFVTYYTTQWLQHRKSWAAAEGSR